MAEFQPVDLQVQDLPEEIHDKLSQYIMKELDDAEQARSELEGKWKTWFLQWEGRLKREDKKDSWQPDLDIPTTRERGQQALSRIHNPIVQEDRLYVAVPRDPDFDEFGKGAEGFLDYQCDQWDTAGVLFEVGKNALIYTSGFLKDSWQHTTRRVKTSQIDQMTGMVSQVESEVDDRVGVFPRSIAPQNILFPANATSLDVASWVAEHLFLTEHEVKERVAKGEWLQADFSRTGDVSELSKEQAKVAGVDLDEERTIHVWEWYGYFDWNEDGRDEEVIVWIDRNNGHIFKAVVNYYESYTRPYLSWSWEPVYDSVWGRSFCQILESVHKAISAYFMIRLEGAALASGQAYATTDLDVSKRFKNRRLASGEMLYIPEGKDAIWPLPLTQQVTELPRLLEELERHADRLAGITDYNMGNESISRPTASGQIALIEEGKQPLYLKLNHFRRFIGELGLRILSRYKQFFPDQLPYFQMTKEGQLAAQFLKFPAGLIDNQLIIETKASSSTLNENVRKQEMVGLNEQMKTYYQMLMQFLQLATTPGPTQMVALTEAMSMREMMNRVLDAFRVPRPEKINPDFTGEVMAGVQLALQLMSQQMQNPALAGAPGVPGGGPGEAAPPGGLEGGQGVAGGAPEQAGTASGEGREPRAYHRSAGLPRPQ